MIFDVVNHDYMNNMMGFSPYSWIIFVLGGAFFLIIIIILIYFLTRNKSKDLLINSSSQVNNDYDNYSKIKTRASPLISEKSVTSRDMAYFCPNCGEKLEERTLKYCPYCGSEIKAK